MFDAVFSDGLTDDGENVYVTVADGQVVRCEELIPGRVNADYDADDKLLGIEVLR